MKAYYEDAFVRLYHGDCRDILPDLAISPAMVVADPPYGQTSLAWDQWSGEWLSYIAPCIRSLWCFGSLRMFMEHGLWFEAGGWKLSQDLVWEKHNGSSFHADRFRRVHESICHFYRGEWSTIKFFTPTTPDATARTVRRKQRPAHMGHIEAGAYESQDGGPRLMRSVLYHPSMHGKANHPTQKPVELIKPLIHYGGTMGSTVIVPFAGAGSELIAAKEIGCPAIGIEIEEVYCEAAAKRLTNTMSFNDVSVLSPISADPW